ncbi:MAG: hypothetical protein AAGL24_09865 [Pseudomonadota bacterium]
MIHMCELEISGTTGDAWAVFDVDGSVVFEIPKTLAPDTDTALALLRFVVPVINRAEGVGIEIGRQRMREDLRQLLAWPTPDEVGTLRARVDSLDAVVMDMLEP